MAKSKSQFYAIAQACMALSVSAPTVEERDTFLDFAGKWHKMASEEEVPLAPLERSTARRVPSRAKGQNDVAAMSHRKKDS